MKKNSAIVIIIVAIVIASMISAYHVISLKNPFSPSTILTNDQKQDIVVSVDFGNGTIRSTKVSAQSPLEAVEKAAIEGGFVVMKKEYDFGVLITSINGFENSSQKAWMYYVNGKAGVQASNVMRLSPSDMVEWKYQSL